MVQSPEQNTLTYSGCEVIKLFKGQGAELPARPVHAFAVVLQQKLSVTLHSASTYTGGEAYSGELFYIPTHCRCQLRSMAQQATSLLLVYFTYAAAFSEPSAELAPVWYEASADGSFHSCRMPPPLQSWVHDFCSQSQPSSDPVRFYRQQSHLYAIASRFIESAQKSKPSVPNVTGYVEYVRRFMLERHSQPLDIEDIARASGVSPSRFYRAFREHTGISPLKYITKVRMDTSLHLLAGTASVLETAHAVGYPDEYYFSRLFKKYMGLTASEYTACAKKKVANLCGVFAGDLFVLGITPSLSVERGWQDSPESVLQQLSAAQPELILTGPVSEELHHKLLDIAPVAVLRWKEYSWKQRLLDISRLLGLEPVAERWLAYYDLKAANARRHVQRHLGSEPFLIVHVWDDRFYLFGMKRRKLRDIFYEDLQVMPPCAARDISMIRADSLQKIAELDCDNVLFLTHSATPQAYCRELEQSWCNFKRSRTTKRCLFIRQYDTPLYNALVNENLVEQMVTQLLNSSG